MGPPHPLKKHLSDWLPEVDVAVLAHGFAAHGRDYIIMIQDSIGPKPGTYELTFTHTVQLNYATRVGDDLWVNSWDDVFVDYQRWELAGKPSGFLWGTNWSLAYPGIDALVDSDDAVKWTRQLGKPMYAASIETELFRIVLVFHDVRFRRISDDTSTVSQVMTPAR